jgi:membrane protein implicated in regulation of membrane protease activity
MLILGLLLIVVAAVAAVGAVFVSSGEVSYFGVDVDPLSYFLIGAGAVVLLVLGLKLVRTGAKRQLRQRREHKRLAQLSDKLDKVDQDREQGRDHDEPSG